MRVEELEEGYASGVPGLPADLLGPAVRSVHHLPDEGRLRLRVALPVLAVLPGQTALQFGVEESVLLVGPDVVAEQQGELLRPASRLSHMDVGPSAPGRFPEVPLGQLRVVRPEDKPQPLQA